MTFTMMTTNELINMKVSAEAELTFASAHDMDAKVDACEKQIEEINEELRLRESK